MRNTIKATTTTILIAATMITPVVAAGRAAATGQEVLCFVHALEPVKYNSAETGSPIHFGYRAHCNTQPDLLSVAVKLWRGDGGDYAVQYAQEDNGVLLDAAGNAGKSWLSECRPGATRVYAYHTEAVSVGIENFHTDRHDSNSETVFLPC